MLGLPSRLLSGPLIRIVDFIMSGIIGLPGWWILLG
jgi:hypothetical protein